MPEVFGRMPSGQPVYRVVLENDSIRVQVLTFGAVLQTIEVPDRSGQRANVALGLTTLEEYLLHSPHFGAVPGRYAGRIGNGTFTLDGVRVQLAVNSPPNTLHGGFHGFGKRNWSLLEHDRTHAQLTLLSPDGEEGFPGTLQVMVRYTIDGPTLRIDYHAESDSPTVLNLTNHSYFNLAGEGAGDIFGHTLTVHAAEYLPIGATGVPTGNSCPVDGTPFDFRLPRLIGARLRHADEQLRQAGGYDHAYVLGGTGFRRAAHLTEPTGGRTLTVQTTEPVLHLYTGNNLTGTLAGPSRRLYRSGDAVCLEAEHPQDAPNHSGFPSTTLRPGTPFSATTSFEFGVE